MLISAVTNGKPSSSYRMAFCVEHATYGSFATDVTTAMLDDH